MIILKTIDELLYDIANRERGLEIERKEKLETKAQRFTTFGGIFISIISTYFIFTANNQDTIPLLIKWELIVAVMIFGISLFLLLLSMRTLRDKTFDVEKLTKKISDNELNVALAKIIGNLIQYTKFIRNINNHRAKLLYFGIDFFFGGLICMIAGIISMVVIV